MPGDQTTIPRALVALASAAAVSALAASFIGGAPGALPGAALGWPVILYLERAAIVAAIVLGFGGVMSELLRGGRVSSVGGGPLPAVDVESAPDAEIRVLEARLDALERLLHDDHRSPNEENG